MKPITCMLPLFLLASISATGCVEDSNDEQSEDPESVGEASAAVVSTSFSERAYDAEAFNSQNGCVVASDRPGFTGSGFVDFGGNGSWAQWSKINVAADGQYTVRFRYGNGDAISRPATIFANGASAGTVQFKTTGSWDTWKMSSPLTLTLHKGQNTIRVQASTAAGGPNLDTLKVTSSRVILGKAAGTTLRFASYNVLQGSIFEQEARKASFARIAPAVDADIWSMQEVSYGDNAAPASEGDQWLARMKSITGYEDWSYSWDATGRYLLSRYPIKWSKALEFRVHATWIDLPAGVSPSDLVVVNVHFAPSNDSAQRKEAVAVTNFINAVKAGTYSANGSLIPSNVTVVVAGDFNSQSGARPFKIIDSLDTRFKDDAFNQSYAPKLFNVSPHQLNTANEKKTHGKVQFTNGVGAMDGKIIDYIMFDSSKLEHNGSFILNTLLLDQGTLNAVGMKRADVAVSPNAAIGANSNVDVDHLPLITDFRLH